MYFLDVMTFEPTLKKYISTDPTQTKLIFPTSTMVNTTLEWVFHGFKGFAKNFFLLQKSEFTMEVGGWFQVSLGIFLEYHPKITPNQY